MFATQSGADRILQYTTFEASRKPLIPSNTSLRWDVTWKVINRLVLDTPRRPVQRILRPSGRRFAAATSLG